jgi:hypothetical protein
MPPGYFYLIPGWHFFKGGDGMQHIDYAVGDYTGIKAVELLTCVLSSL